MDENKNLPASGIFFPGTLHMQTYISEKFLLSSLQLMEVKVFPTLYYVDCRFIHPSFTQEGSTRN